MNSKGFGSLLVSGALLRADLGRLSGPLRGILGRLGGVLGASWERLERVLEAFWRHLGALWMVFRSFGSVFEAISCNIEKP